MKPLALETQLKRNGWHKTSCLPMGLFHNIEVWTNPNQPFELRYDMKERYWLRVPAVNGTGLGDILTPDEIIMAATTTVAYAGNPKLEALVEKTRAAIANPTLENRQAVHKALKFPTSAGVEHNLWWACHDTVTSLDTVANFEDRLQEYREWCTAHDKATTSPKRKAKPDVLEALEDEAEHLAVKQVRNTAKKSRAEQNERKHRQ